jgi:hypothetical protein
VLASFDLGVMNCRNSTFAECLVGYAFMGVSTGYFLDKREALTAEQISRVAAAIERAEAEHETLATIFQRDVALYEHAYGWQWRIEDLIRPGKRDAEMWEQMQRSHDRWLAMNRLLVTDLAIRRHRRERGEWPVSLESLVPEFIQAVPEDPLSHKPLIYVVLEDGFALYSVGQDGLDNGGRFGGGFDSYQAGIDLDLDSLTREPGTVVGPFKGAGGTE